MNERKRLTFVEIFGRDSENGVLDVFIFVHLGLVESLVEVGRVVVLVGNSDADEFGH